MDFDVLMAEKILALDDDKTVHVTLKLSLH